MQKKINSITILALISIEVLVAGCTSQNVFRGEISRAPFGTTADGEHLDLYTLRSGNGIEVQICNYGGIITSLKVPDRKGKLGDVVLGYDSLHGYLTNSPYFGALIGRYGNRIAKGQFTLNGIH